MAVIEIEKQIKPLSREEKEELFKYLARELGKEGDVSKYLTLGCSYPIYTPNISPNGSHLKTMEQLQKVLKAA